MKILILGGGVSGKAAKKLADVMKIKAQIVSDGDWVPPLKQFNLAVISPGIRPESRLLQSVKAQNLEIISEMEFGFRCFPGKVLAITGTNGKTTTTELTTHLLKSVNFNAEFAGNIGRPLADLSAEIMSGNASKDLTAVVEVSSFQLEYIDRFTPYAALCLNLKSDHIDRYNGSFELYKATKMKIFNRVLPERTLFGSTMTEYQPKMFRENSGTILYQEEKLFDYNETQLRGGHNLENLLGALELCGTVLTPEQIRSEKFLAGVKSFTTGRHRLEKFQYHDILCVNDSKATNPSSVAAAIRTLCAKPQGNIRIILGGLDKDMDFSEISDCFPYLKKGYIIGQCKDKIVDFLGSRLPYEVFEDFKSCVEKMKSEAQSGEILLLSPGCASMDMFKNYEDRGNQFIKLMEE